MGPSVHCVMSVFVWQINWLIGQGRNTSRGGSREHVQEGCKQGCNLNLFVVDALGIVAKPKAGKSKLSDPKFLLQQQDCRYFWLQDPPQCGISLEDALATKHVQGVPGNFFFQTWLERTTIVVQWMIALLGTNTYPIKSHNFESMIFPTSPGSHASEGGSHQGVRLVKGWGENGRKLSSDRKNPGCLQ